MPLWHQMGTRSTVRIYPPVLRYGTHLSHEEKKGSSRAHHRSIAQDSGRLKASCGIHLTSVVLPPPNCLQLCKSVQVRAVLQAEAFWIRA